MLDRVRTIGTQSRRTTSMLFSRVGKRYNTINRRAGRLELFPAVGFALSAGLVVAIGAYGLLHWAIPASEAKAAPIDITRVALTIVAGVGGVVALVIAYRRQRDIEQSRFVERFGAAASQLGAADVAVRIAGVYAMAGAADQSDGLRRQQCIDVLCGYLRLPYVPDHGSSGRTKLVTTIPRAEGGETEEHVEYRQNDREVRRTILRVIADHLLTEAEYCWSTSNFDFRTAHLEGVVFDAVTFSGLAWFDEATFAGPARFDKATFAGPAGFDRATFTGPAVFNGATFCDRTRFSEVTFNDRAEFRGATFRAVAEFYRATFDGHAELREATFNNAGFYRATFNGHVRFDKVTFNGGLVFHATTFNGHAEFQQATFSHAVDFGKAIFNGRAGFRETKLNGDAQFAEAVFDGPADFAGATFTGRTTFLDADFGSEQVVFDGPARWSPPEPEFDWSRGVGEKPANIEPQDWPRATTTS
ncbi:pentapeptide repeat-containing protein [Nocardia panacis]|uniref:pentapeptide repeat-containing protein n=1 Tax=Nocardia panacis TaxID=2340916 RepID=UPI0013153E21|nr:pentapeptide repeat-containing protein [Nocardia panacis]